MQKGKNRFIAMLSLFILLASFLAVPAQAASGNEGLRDSKTVRVACGMNDALYLDESGEPTGLALPYIRQIAWNAGWALEYVEGSYSESLQKLGNGEIDLMFPIGKDEDPEGKLLYSEFDGGIQQIGLFARADADIYYEDFAHFNGKKIGLSLGGNSLILDDYAKQHGFSYQQVTNENSVQGKISALMNGDVDLIAFSTLNSVPGGKLVAVLDQLPVYFCTSKENTKLYQELNDAISLAMINTPDVVSQCAKDMMTGAATVSLTRAEHDKIESTNTVTFGVYSNCLPLAGVNSDGECVGIYVDTIKAIAKQSGLDIKIVPVADDSRLYSYMDDGTVDFVMSLFDLRFYAENADNYLISNGIGDYTTAAVTRPSYQFESDDSTSFALTNTRDYMKDYIEANFSFATIQYYDTRKACIEAVESGKADATFLNTWEFNYESKNLRFGDLIQWESIGRDSTFAIGATKDSDLELLSILEKTISQLPKSTLTQIIADNLNMRYDSYSLSDRVYMMRDELIIGSMVILLCIAGAWFYLRETKRRSDDYRRVIGYVCTACDSVAELDLKAKKIKRYVVKNGLVQEEYVDNHIEHMFLVDPADRAMVESQFTPEAVREIIQKGEVITFECRMKWNEADEYRWNTCIVQGIRPSKERPYNLLMIIRDIHAMRQEEEKQKRALEDAFAQAKQASLSKGQFLSRMSHEIRTPLNAVIGYMSIGKEEQAHPEKMLHCIEKSEIAAKHLLSIINDVLDISSIESGKMKIAVADLDLDAMLSEITTVFFQQAKSKNIHFEVDVRSVTDEWVVGDSLRVKQVLMNLLSNAVKFTPEGGTIRLKVQQLKKANGKIYFDFEVSDTGIGMSQEYMSRLFQPFEQEDATTAQKYGGSGLGLSITKNLVDMMGGTIQVTSEQNVGTTFRVTLYFGISAHGPIDPLVNQDYSHVRALVVDDEHDDAAYIKSLFHRCKVKSDIVTSGEDALKQLKRRMGSDYAYDLCIIDWNMPGLNGMETSRLIRSEVGTEIPIIIATAYDTTEIETAAAAAGVNRVVAKPLFQSTIFNLLVSNFGKYDPSHGSTERTVDVAGLRVILAEDNEMNMEIGTSVLTKAGIQVEPAVNGKVACDKFLQAKPGSFDLILMDIQMPVMNGYEATRFIRKSQHPEAGTIPIIAMTANAFAEDVAEALANGMNDHISKPIDQEKLLCAIQNLTKNHAHLPANPDESHPQDSGAQPE